MTASGGRTRRKASRKKAGRTRPLGMHPWWIAAAAVLVVALLWLALRPASTPPGGGISELEDSLRSMAADHGVDGDDLDVDLDIRKVDGVFVRSWELRFPNLAAREEFIAEVAILADADAVAVHEPVTEVGGTVRLRVDHGIEAFSLGLSVSTAKKAEVERGRERPPTRSEPTPRREPPPGSRGRLAILLDDAGQRMDLVPAAAKLPASVAVAVLPFLPYSAETALELYAAGHEIWLHLPMEAVGDEEPGPGALMMAMSDDELRDTVYMAVNNVPHVVGINNHMGSRATADLRMMTWVMQELKAMDLAFIDSRTTVDTVAEEAARAQGVKAGRRHVFLDNDRSPEAIRRQLDEAVYRARTEGAIIAIGHLNEMTVEILAEEAPKLAGRGADLVAPSELLD